MFQLRNTRFHKLKEGRLDISLVLISAMLLVLSFLPVANLEFLAWFAFIPLFFALRNKKPAYAFLLSYLCGLVFFIGTIYWLINVTFIGFALFILYLALYFGVFGLVISFTRSRVHALTRLFFIPSIWVLLEYLRSHLFTGFGWALLGYSQYLNLPIIQIADIAGVWCVSFLLMMINVLIYSVISHQLSVSGEKKIILPLILGISCLFFTLTYGYYQIHRTPNPENQITIKISVIQGNIPQAIKWEKSARETILREYHRLSRLASLDKPDLIIWPEAALPGALEKEPYLKKNLVAFVQYIQIPLLVGTISLDEDRYYNSAILISNQGEFLQRYDKLHLVPFGEYIPLKRLFTFLETIVPIGDFTPGKEYIIFDLPKDQQAGKAKFSVLICFEDIFAQISRKFVKKGADLLVNITNDAWFGRTVCPYQHLQASVFRAVENSVCLVRAANTGISGFITSEGRIFPLTDDDSVRQTFVSGYKTKDIYINHKQNSLYTLWGDWFILVCLIVVIGGIFRVKSKG